MDVKVVETGCLKAYGKLMIVAVAVYGVIVAIMTGVYLWKNQKVKNPGNSSK